MQAEKTLLCVDDEVNTLSALKRLLRKEEVQIITAESGMAALELLKTQQVQLILTDFRMPGMNGIEFLKQAKQIAPHAVRVVLSGYADLKVLLDAVNEGEVYRFITKPWEDHQLLATLQQCFEYYQLLEDNRIMHQELIQLNLKLKNKIITDLAEKNSAKQIVDSLPEGLVAIDHNGLIQFVNPYAKKRYGERLDFKNSKKIEQLFNTETVDAIQIFMLSMDAVQELTVEIHGYQLLLLLYPQVKEGERSGCIIRLVEIS